MYLATRFVDALWKFCTWLGNRCASPEQSQSAQSQTAERLPLISGLSTLPTSGRAQLYGLIVGIDEYALQSVPTLGGAVADAAAMYSYMQSTLGAPSQHITSLVNAEATRSAIVASFRRLIEDERITRDDAILIYYAGHGTSLNWRPFESTKVRAILPHDYGIYGDHRRKESPIRALNIDSLLRELAERKGNNVVSQFRAPEHQFELTAFSLTTY